MAHADPICIARDLAKLSDGEVVIIGGIAAYLHIQRRPKSKLPLESTHDADMVVSDLGMGTLRDLLPVTSNPRLHKDHVVIEDIDVDLYPQSESRLRFDYNDIALYAQTYRGMRIASIPHLVLLKLDALADRGKTQKGAKDRRDVAKLLILLDGSPQMRTLLRALATASDLKALDDVVHSSAFMDIGRGNAKIASELRKKAESVVEKVSSP